MKTEFEKKYQDSFSPSEQGAESEFDAQVEAASAQLVENSEYPLSVSEMPPISEMAPFSQGPSEAPASIHSASLSSMHSRLSSFFPEHMLAGRRWPGWLASFLAGAVIGATVVYFVMAAQPPRTIVKEKVVTKPQIVYRDAPLSNDAGSVASNAEMEEEAVKRPRKERRNGGKKGRSLSREERKQQLLASLNVGAGAGKSGTSGGAQGGSLTASQVNRVVSRNRSSLQYCYERELKKGTASAYGDLKVSFSLTVGKSGTVTNTRVMGQGAKIPELKKCLTGAVKRWVFPAAGSSSAVEFPIIFTPAR